MMLCNREAYPVFITDQQRSELNTIFPNVSHGLQRDRRVGRCACIYLVTWIVGAPAELVGSLSAPPAHPRTSVAFWSDYEPHPTEMNA